MSDYLEELLSGISDGLTKELHLFVVNSNLDDKQVMSLIEIINQSYLEGSYSVVPKWVKNNQSNISSQMESFVNEFNKKISDSADDKHSTDN